MSENGSDFGAFMAGFVIGGLVGAATALILAPQSGAETRAQIATKGEELRHASEEQIHTAQARVHETSSHVQERARIVLDEGKGKVDAARHKESASEIDTPSNADNDQTGSDEINEEEAGGEAA